MSVSQIVLPSCDSTAVPVRLSVGPRATPEGRGYRCYSDETRQDNSRDSAPCRQRCRVGSGCRRESRPTKCAQVRDAAERTPLSASPLSRASSLASSLCACFFLSVIQRASRSVSRRASPSILRACLRLPYFGRVNVQVGVFVFPTRLSSSIARADVVSRLSLIPRMHASSSLSLRCILAPCINICLLLPLPLSFHDCTSSGVSLFNRCTEKCASLLLPSYTCISSCASFSDRCTEECVSVSPDFTLASATAYFSLNLCI